MRVWGANSHYHWEHVQRRHWRKTSADCGMAPHFEALWEELVEAAPVALDQVEQTLPADFSASLATQILGGARRSLDRMKQDRS